MIDNDDAAAISSIKVDHEPKMNAPVKNLELVLVDAELAFVGVKPKNVNENKKLLHRSSKLFTLPSF